MRISSTLYSRGVPILGNGVPITDGKYYFVSTRNGADGNSGEKIDDAFATIDQAIDTVNARIGWGNSPWGNNDVIVVLPGVYAESLTALPYGSSIYGIGDFNDNDGNKGVIVKPATGSALNTTSVINCHIENIKFEVTDASDVIEIDEMNSSVFRNCMFEGSAGTCVALKGIDIVKKGTNNLIEHCIFNNTLQGIYLGYTAPGDQFAHSVIQHNQFLTQGTNGIYIHVNQVCSGLHIFDNMITCTGGSSIGIDDNSNTAHIARNYIYSPNDAIEGGLETNGNYANGSLE